ncbi:hypothetical protein [Thiothrix nivea]|uniref:Uncharacterized protein n=1 Tax=Thiothrix nivea (strain ATCC 35100 / DSM 5205 / JP2) TaxID=870187 RepID=A0A656HGX9_THINJ|nr:hypothetical protein [Thiothrix nivea]EIJ34746.1 hypothetical protein Thini_2180 [Thiothrix nivea DSM 5205]
MYDTTTQQDVVNTLIYLRSLLERLPLNGLATVREEDLRLLQQARELFAQHGANYLTDCLQQLEDAIQTQQQAGVKFLQLQTALFLFERLFTRDVCREETADAID